MQIVAFTKYGAQAASTRQRLLMYLPALRTAGIEVEWHALLDDDYVRALASGGRASRLQIAHGYIDRLRQLATARTADLIWIYAELFPYLPAVFERLAFLPGVPVVYDFDDAFFHQYDAHPRRAVQRLLAGKLEPLLRGAAVCTCGNAYLEEYAKTLCASTQVLPTVVDTDRWMPAGTAHAGPLSIGWIGTPSTWNYVRPLLPVLSTIAAERDVRIRIVGAGASAAEDRFPGLDLIEWREESEIYEVQRMDIGIMPLPDEAWARGKSGYKLIQYMACGLPVIASPVGVNTEIVEPGQTGYLASSIEEWRQTLNALLDDASERRRTGINGRARAVERYSLCRNAPLLIATLQSAA